MTDAPDGKQFDRIQPQPIRPSTPEPPPAPSAPSFNGADGANQRPLFIALGVTLLLLLAVVFLLPGLTRSAAPPTIDSTAPVSESEAVSDSSAAAASDDSGDAAPIDAEASLAARQRAQEISEALDSRRSKLEQRAVQRWAAEPYAALSAEYRRAEEAFRQRDYATAADIWQQAILSADNLLEQSGWELLGANQLGQQGLDAGDSAAARAGFELALAIDSDNKTARIGLARAERLDEVMALLRDARRFEQDGNLIAARDYYTEALKLDPATIAAAAGYERTHSELQDREFRKLISKALAATDAARYAEARAHYDAADKIRQGAPEIVDGRMAIALAEQAAAVRRYRRDGARFEASEQWSKALTQYRNALKIDATLAFAREGARRSEQRALLDQGMQAIIDNPDSLFEEKTQNRTRDLLAEARRISPRGERLRGQIEWLQTALAMATTPVDVTLLSDNNTQVLLYKVGKLGSFERKDLSLKPGNYTVVGRCAGYRDERLTFQIRPNQSATAAIDIRCREKL